MRFPGWPTLARRREHRAPGPSSPRGCAIGRLAAIGVEGARVGADTLAAEAWRPYKCAGTRLSTGHFVN
eukprot:scaffold2242_cov370-Prasinococcus_capsulatus_cf.AAC.1